MKIEQFLCQSNIVKTFREANSLIERKKVVVVSIRCLGCFSWSRSYATAGMEIDSDDFVYASKVKHNWKLLLHPSTNGWVHIV